MKANAQSVSRKLATRFRRSTRATTKVRGWHYVSDGFEVQQGKKGVYVSYNIDQSFLVNKEAAFDKRRTNLEAIFQFLTEQGLEAKLFDNYVYAIEKEIA